MIDGLIILTLILLNGVFALSEMAIISSRRSALRALVSLHRKGAASALALADTPSRFLSSVQIGITLVSLANGAYSGETFGPYAIAWLKELGVPANIAAPLGFSAVILFITYLSVIVGELIPKSLALRNAEAIACSVAPFMAMFARLAAPAVWFLDTSTRLVLRLFGIHRTRRSTVSDEEIKALIAEAEIEGVIETGERDMISGVMRFADRSVVSFMTPRGDVEWIDLELPDATLVEKLSVATHSLLPAGRGSTSDLVGVVRIRDLLGDCLNARPLSIRQHVETAPIVPETMRALDALQILRDADVPMALIHGEYGDFVGLVTPADILRSIAGAFRSDIATTEPLALQRKDGSWLLSGTLPIDEMADHIGMNVPVSRSYKTVAGFLLAHFQHIPRTGENVVIGEWRFEVVDLDGRRIDKVMASRVPPKRRILEFR